MIVTVFYSLRDLYARNTNNVSIIETSGLSEAQIMLSPLFTFCSVIVSIK